MEQTLKILVIEDSPADFLLVERHLWLQGMAAACIRVDSPEALEGALNDDGWDIILSDYSLPKLDFFNSLASIQSRRPDLPVILVSGSVGEEQAVDLLRLGVRDFVLKDNLARLIPAIDRSLGELKEKKARLAAENAMRESECRFRSIFNNSPVAIGIGRKYNGRLVEVNDAWLQLYGFERDEVIGRTTAELNLYARAEDRNEFIRIIDEHGHVVNHEVQLRRKSGEIIFVQYSAELITLGEESYLQVMMTDISEQKRIETELLKSLEMYRSLFENMLNGFAYCRMIFDGDTPQDFIYLSVNDAFGKQTGLEDVVGRRVTEVIPGIRESDDGLFEAYGRVAMTGNPEQFEIYVEALEQWFWISVYSPAREYFVAVFDVITERKRAEVVQEATLELLHICNNSIRLPELIRQMMSYFQKISGCEAVGVRLREGEDFPYYETRGFSEEFVLAEKHLCTYDQKGELIRDVVGHPALECMCGNILCGRFDPSKSFFTPHGSFWSSSTTELLANTADADRQAKTRNRCNGEGYESVALIPLRYHNKTFGLFQFNDKKKGCFTPEKISLYENLVNYLSIAISKLISDEALRESEQFNLQIINNAEEGVVVYGTDLRYRVWNSYMERLYGIPASKVIGMHPLDLFPFLKDEGMVERLEKVLGGQPPSSIEFPFHSSYNGYAGWASDTTSLLKNATGEIIGVIGMVRDISDRKQAEEELHKKNAEIEQFIYTVSHDLRSPLVTVKTFMGYLEEDIVGDKQVQLAQDIQFIHNAADKMKLLLDELLELSRIGRIETAPVSVSLMEVLTEALDALAGDIRERKVDIRLPAADLMLFGDRPRLCQIWQNLIENAIKYNRKGSIPRIDLGFQHMNGETVFFVKDNGIGIEPHYLGKIFKIFEKLDPKSPGAGLGLSMIQRIVEKCGGRIWVESEGIGKGSCFFFTLPNALVQA